MELPHEFKVHRHGICVTCGVCLLWQMLIDACPIPMDKQRLQRNWCAVDLVALQSDERFPRRIRMRAVEVLEQIREIL